jgi:hypothetical protein
MVRGLIFALFFVCLACQSQSKSETSQRTPDQAAPAGKVTREEVSNSVELQVELEAGPTGSDMDVIMSPGILECLRQGFDPKDLQFAVHMQGRISGGKLSSPSVDGGNPAQRACLKAELARLSFAGGKIFKMHISREGGGPGSKSFILELKGPKKFQ